MSGQKRLADLRGYASLLPYASEIFGIYQPLLGWKSKRTENRFFKGMVLDQKDLFDGLVGRFEPLVKIDLKDHGEVEVDLRPGDLKTGPKRKFGTVVMEEVAALLPSHDDYKSNVWNEVLTSDRFAHVFKEAVVPTYSDMFPKWEGASHLGRRTVEMGGDRFASQKQLFHRAIESQLKHESAVAGALLFLAKNKNYDKLESLFYDIADNSAEAAAIRTIMVAASPLVGYLNRETLDPQDKEHIRRVALSPISVVHLFRQYFFELDTFLGSPISHVWLSPGSTVELIEIQTRRSYIEKSIEQSLETVSKTAKDTTEEDEISDAVKRDNKQDIKFGASVTASYAGVTATSSFDYGTSQQTAREETHKRMRQQTEKLSTEIRKNYKSTFKTITEETDISSKRYLLNNVTSALINYELRRKMRQVAVQVQDIGTYLCWQTYVDRPGEALGIANLMHIAKPADLDGLHAPDEIPMLQPFVETKVVTIPFVSIDDTEADNEGEVYKDGVEVDDNEVGGWEERIQADHVIDCVCSKSDYVLTNVECDGQGKPVTASRKGPIKNSDNKASFVLHLDTVDFQGQNSIQVGLKLHWAPGSKANDAIVKKNRENRDAFKAKESAAYEKAFVETAEERIKLTHEIKPRPSADLREEERIVVYRKLIQDMLMKGVSLPDDRTRHVVAEVINSIFDVDKMLYFVAPEWWRPRLRIHEQQLDETDAAQDSDFPLVTLPALNVYKKIFALDAMTKSDPLSPHSVGWGGVHDLRRDNYYITKDSEPAAFGSSLGWLLQLDGDNLRNAFLNAPWVKAVIPIRPGREEAALNWLKGVEGFNGIGENEIYQTNNPNEKDINGKPLNGQKMQDVILNLAKEIRKKHEEAVKNGKFPKASEVSDPTLVDEDNIVTATPIDRVYEHGFYPLKGGFRANVTGNYEIFDQWLEILPTDQVVPVEVKYDPKTGRQE